MSAIFKDWIISTHDELLARQYDNNSRSLVVTGDLPEGWDWYMLVHCQGHYDSIPLTPMDGGVGVILTDAQLAYRGQYDMQLRGVQGDIVRHTNVIPVYIPASLSGTGTWPEIPSEFTALEARMRDIAAHPPIPGDNGYWRLWDPDTGAYADSQFPLPAGGGGGGTISVTDDGYGNVEITAVPSSWIVTDDGNGNVVIGG